MQIEKVVELIKNTDEKCPIKMAYKSNHRYYSDFMSVLRRFKDVLSDKEFNELVSKFQFDKAYERHKYFEIVSEIIILDFVLRNYNQEKKFKYEPKYNGGYNPECSFINKSKTINIEVKCPNLEKRLNSEDKDKMKIFLQDRLPNFKEIENDAINKCNPQIEDRNNSGVEVRKRLDNALKSYLIHSQKKFPSSGDTYFNILAISLRTVSDLDEWYSYIFGNEGVFTDNSFVSENYENVDAILLTRSIYKHLEWDRYDDVDIWNLEDEINILLLNPKKENSEIGEYYKQYGIDMFGESTRKFLSFQRNKDILLREKLRKSNLNNCYIEDLGKYIEELIGITYKIDESNIITEFINS